MILNLIYIAIANYVLMKATILAAIFVFLTTNIFAQCPPNMDFELGDFANWQCFTGSTSSSMNTNSIRLNSSNPTAGRHTIMSSKSDKDYYGGFPVLCPFGGNYSVKLGNDNVNAEAEGISFTFSVPANIDTFTFTYFYAVVLEDPQHASWDQPRFSVTAYEVSSGKVIDCAAFNYVANGALPGFVQSSKARQVWYKDWTPVSLQFYGLNNKQVRLEFKNADCTLGGHFGYSYLDVASGCSNIIATAPYCIESNSLNLNAPYGFKDYIWYDSTFTNVLGTTQNITLSPAPIISGSFYVAVSPYPGYGCKDTFQAIIKPLSIPPPPSIQTDYYFCQFQSNAILNVTPESGNVIIWYGKDTLQSGSETPPIINTSKIGDIELYIAQKQLFGCEGYKKKIVVHIIGFSNSEISVNRSTQCFSVNNFSFQSIASTQSNINYTWSFGDGDTLSTNTDTSVFHKYQRPGTFYVNLLANYFNQCTSRKIVTVLVIPSPISVFTSTSPICENQTTVNFTDVSRLTDGSRITGWWWNINGKIDTTRQTSYFPIADTVINVKFLIKTSDGCPSDTSIRSLTVQQKPIPKFEFREKLLCSEENLLLINQSFFVRKNTNEVVNKWNWQINTNKNYNTKDINNVFKSGLNQVKLKTESNFGCQSNTLDTTFMVYQKPYLDLSISDSCINKRVTYLIVDTTNTVINNWQWNFGNGFYKANHTFTTFYPKTQNIPINIIGTTPVGCTDTIIRNFKIYDNIASAGNDTIAAFEQPVQLDANGYPNQRYIWTPSFGLSNDTIVNPIALNKIETTYYLYSITKEGCEKNSKVNIKRYTGPALYIPNAFTPNDDHINDVVHVFPVGIKKFIHFSIYNRWGNLVFRTTDPSKGWDGKYKGVLQSNNVFIAVSEAIDYRANSLKYKGTISVLK